MSCGPYDPDGYTSSEPVLVIEVLSPSTRDFDTVETPGEYRSVESLRFILYCGPDVAEAVLWSRNAERRWDRSRIDGLEATVDLPDLALSLGMADLCEGVAFPPGPRLVRG